MLDITLSALSVACATTFELSLSFSVPMHQILPIPWLCCRKELWRPLDGRNPSVISHPSPSRRSRAPCRCLHRHHLILLSRCLPHQSGLRKSYRLYEPISVHESSVNVAPRNGRSSSCHSHSSVETSLRSGAASYSIDEPRNGGKARHRCCRGCDTPGI